MKKQWCLLIMLIPLMVKTQVISANNEGIANTGIQWATSLSWEQVKEKAKVENKYIFIDAYTTWCKPCKLMDKFVYTNDTIGNYFNENFVSIKVQFDKTTQDNEFVKHWYDDVTILEKEYRVKAFPTYIFVSPQGTWVHNASGYQSVPEFIKTAQTALQPGKVFTDSNDDYYKMAKDYEQGRKDYSIMAYLRKRALELNERELANAVGKEYEEYLSGRDQSEWFTKENIEFLASKYIASSSPFFTLFYPNSHRVDALMNQKGFAAKVVENTVRGEVVSPFYGSYGFEPGRTLGDKVDSTEANWNNLYQSVCKLYGPSHAKRSVLDARIAWYDTKQNRSFFLKYYFRYLKKYGIDTVLAHQYQSSLYYHTFVNFYCWRFVFERSTDKSILKKAIKLMGAVVDLKRDCMYMDTYANLLYKSGKKTKAIEWEEKALQGAIELKFDNIIKDHAINLEKMKRGEITWKAENKTQK